MSELEDLLSIREQKAALRAKITRLERQISADEYALSDAALISGLMALPVYEQAGTIMLFSSFGYEPAMSGLMEDCRRRGKRVFLPRMLPGNRLECCEISESEMLVPGKYGILEPSRLSQAADPAEISLIVVPAVCYDRMGYRLGRGAGYYDRMLAVYSGETVGLCRERFLQDKIPKEIHDARVGIVVTEHAVYKSENRRDKSGY